MRRLAALALLLAPALFAPAAARAPGDPQAGDPQAGARLFRACAACHQIGAGARHGVGPALTGVVDGPAAGQTDYRYSAAMTAAAARGLVWTHAALDAFLADPRTVLPGTGMAFAGLRDAGRRADLIAYLDGFSPRGAPKSDPAPVPHLRPGDPELPEALRGIRGDPEYGEYLAQECVTCHQLSGAAQGIPAITGWPEAELARALNAYRVGARENPAMRMIAGRLDDEGIAALAAWFAAQGPRPDE